jgi:hypothetical protein
MNCEEGDFEVEVPAPIVLWMLATRHKIERSSDERWKEMTLGVEAKRPRTHENVANLNRIQAASILWLLRESYYKLTGNARTSVNEKAKLQLGLATSLAGRE